MPDEKIVEDLAEILRALAEEIDEEDDEDVVDYWPRETRGDNQMEKPECKCAEEAPGKARQIAEVIVSKAMSPHEETRRDAQLMVSAVSETTYEYLYRASITLLAACAFRRRSERRSQL